MASAELANRTVNQSQTVTANTKIVCVKRACCGKAFVGAVKSRRINSIVVIALPTSTTNMTGFLSCTRGSSFLNESSVACLIILASKIERLPLRRDGCERSGLSVCFVFWFCRCVVILEGLSLQHQQMLNYRAKRVSWKVGERTDDKNDAYQQCHEHHAVGGEGTQSSGNGTFLHQRAADGHDRDKEGKAPDEHGESQRPVIVGRIGTQACHR